MALRLIGVAYLAWLAGGAFRDARRGVSLGAAAREGAWFRQGLVVNLTNPRMALFFLAFLLRFVLGVCFMVMGYVVDTAVGLLAGTLQRRLAPTSSAARTLSLVYLCLAAVVAWELVAALGAW